MADASPPTDEPRRDRSPSFPYIGLQKALERARLLFKKAGRYEVLLDDAATNWGLGPKSSATLQTVAALAGFGLIEYRRADGRRRIRISDTGGRILDDARPGVRETLLAEAALKPKMIAEYAAKWKDGRPDDAHCISQLKFDSQFTDDGAQKFLSVFDETIGFTNSAVSDKKSDNDVDDDHHRGDRYSEAEKRDNFASSEPTKSPRKGRAILMEGERILQDGILGRDTSYRIVVSGRIGVKEIERLIAKLEIDKESLADEDEDASGEEKHE